jgi:UDP-N-acetylmuramoyl-L-alanyl-D-glutamate--2,6-diaminopimelate ligase
MNGLTLADLVAEAEEGAYAHLEVTGVSADSRAVVPGGVFVALSGSKADGAVYIPQALAKGAVAIVGQTGRPYGLPADIAYIQVADARLTLALAAAQLYPRQPEIIVAVTGTSGKSSVAEFTRQIFRACGRQAASLGTIGVVAPSGALYGSLTTPDPVSLHATLDKLAGEGVTHLAMEASSHGLDQRRLDGVRLRVAGFTNLGRDHLDYHPTMDEYFAAKRRLFDALLPVDGIAVVNADDAYGAQVIAAAQARHIRVMSVGAAGKGIALEQLTRDGFGQRLSLHIDGKLHEVTLPLVGDFQAANALLAAGMAIATGERVADVLAALPKLEGVKGRLERVGEARGGLCVVDYAHKPDALSHMLDALRLYVTGKLICIVGCGGDRDRGKRPLMGAIAVNRADVVIVTDDNPRSEDPASIRAAILAAAPGAIEIADRAAAIRAGVAMLDKGDVLVVAGKGHETGQIIGNTTLPFSDHDELRKAIAEVAA